MIDRSDILWLGVVSAVIGSLVGGLLLGIGMIMVIHGQVWGLAPMMAALPASAFPGWMLARRLAARVS
jgi:hypothetical protein